MSKLLLSFFVEGSSHSCEVQDVVSLDATVAALTSLYGKVTVFGLGPITESVFSSEDDYPKVIRASDSNVFGPAVCICSVDYELAETHVMRALRCFYYYVVSTSLECPVV